MPLSRNFLSAPDRHPAPLRFSRFRLKGVPRRPGGNGGHKPEPGAFSPRDPVVQTGIYEVIHHQAHREAHEVVMLSKDNFPACDTCHDKVRFRLIRTAPYIFQDEDFEDDPSN